MTEQTQPTQKLVLCPYCGHAQFGGDRCEDCGGLFEPLSRRATQLAMGPWQIRDKHNPFRPGCCYDVVMKMASSGKIKPTTVMRGPTTRQFWSIAKNVPGVAHLIGYCHECGSHVTSKDTSCNDCGALFIEPRERNELGLIFKNDIEAMRGQEALDAELRGETPPPRAMPGPTKRQAPKKPAGATDLLSEVLDLSGDFAPIAPPASSGPASAPPGPVAKPIDFTPPPQSGPMPPSPTSAFDVDPTRELPESRGIGTMGMVMLALNIIAVATIVVLWIMLRD